LGGAACGIRGKIMATAARPRVTELNDIPVIHRTVSTGNLKVTEGGAGADASAAGWRAKVSPRRSCAH
jgi:hypothetical protein